MPTYDYRCARCGHAFEVVQKMSDPKLKRCPACKAMKLERVIHPPAIAFKGPGFYKTDSRKAGSDRSPGSSGSSEKKTETKTSDAAKQAPKSTSKDASKDTGSK